MLLVGGFILLTIWVNIDLIFHILPNGEIYAEAKNVVFILGLSQLALATFTICFTALNYSRYYAFSLIMALVLTVSALLLNNYLVPRLGMDGAAWSNLLSYGLYYLLVILTVCITCRLQIINRRWWYTFLLLLALFALNALWQHYMVLSNIWLDSLLRSLVFIGGGALIAYFAKLSPEINEQIKNYRLKITNHS